MICGFTLPLLLALAFSDRSTKERPQTAVRDTPAKLRENPSKVRAASPLSQKLKNPKRRNSALCPVPLQEWQLVAVVHQPAEDAARPERGDSAI